MTFRVGGAIDQSALFSDPSFGWAASSQGEVSASWDVGIRCAKGELLIWKMLANILLDRTSKDRKVSETAKGPSKSYMFDKKGNHSFNDSSISTKYLLKVNYLRRAITL